MPVTVESVLRRFTPTPQTLCEVEKLVPSRCADLNQIPRCTFEAVDSGSTAATRDLSSRRGVIESGSANHPLLDGLSRWTVAVDGEWLVAGSPTADPNDAMVGVPIAATGKNVVDELIAE